MKFCYCITEPRWFRIYLFCTLQLVVQYEWQWKIILWKQFFPNFLVRLYDWWPDTVEIATQMDVGECNGFLGIHHHNGRTMEHHNLWEPVAAWKEFNRSLHRKFSYSYIQFISILLSLQVHTHWHTCWIALNIYECATIFNVILPLLNAEVD